MSELGIVLAILCVAVTLEATANREDRDAVLVATFLLVGALVLGILGAVYA